MRRIRPSGAVALLHRLARWAVDLFETPYFRGFVKEEATQLFGRWIFDLSPDFVGVTGKSSPD